MYFPKVRWRTKPCSTRARLIWGNLRRKEQGRGRVFFKKTANKANSDGNLRGSRAHFYINYSSPACPALRALLLQREDTLGEIASSFFTYTCREKNSLARFKKKKKKVLNFHSSKIFLVVVFLPSQAKRVGRYARISARYVCSISIDVPGRKRDGKYGN